MRRMWMWVDNYGLQDYVFLCGSLDLLLPWKKLSSKQNQTKLKIECNEKGQISLTLSLVFQIWCVDLIGFVVSIKSSYFKFSKKDFLVDPTFTHCHYKEISGATFFMKNAFSDSYN